MSYPPGQKPPQWSIDSGVVAYNASRLGLPMPTGLWAMWEKGGDTLYNLGSVGGKGQLTAGTTWQNRGINFDGVNNYGDLSGDFAAQKRTFIAWVSTLQSDIRIFHECDDNDYYISNGGVYLWVYDSANTRVPEVGEAGSGLDDGKIHMLAITGDGTTTRIYIDGIEEGSRLVGNYDLTHFDRTRIRISDTSLDWIGNFYQCVVFNCALTASQIKSLYINPYGLIADPYQIETLGYVAAVGAEEQAVSGSMPYSTGSITKKGVDVSLAGDTPYSTGSYTLKVMLPGLSGDMPYSMGSVFKAIAVDLLEGDMPYATAILASKIVMQQVLAGAVPASSGDFALKVLYGVSGVMGAVSGTLAFVVGYSLSGVMGAISGLLTKLTTAPFAGDVPHPTGTLSPAFVTSESTAGDMPASSGAVTSIKNPTPPTEGIVGIIGANLRKILGG